ncbi:FUCL6-like protein, partial [Mya arenaria]
CHPHLRGAFFYEGKMNLKRKFIFSFILLFGKGFCDGNFEGQNVALGKTQQTDQGPGTLDGFKANLAVDGNESHSADSGACAHTTEGNDTYKAWWKLDLGQPYWISGIKIFNREHKQTYA